MLLAVTLLVIEGFANIWWYQINTCAFENNDLFKNLDDDRKRQLCLESFDLQYSETGILANQAGSTVFINNEGFRGPEIIKQKPENTYRIFVVGGSTTFGVGVLNNETAPALLQEKFEETDFDFKVEVINAGIPGAGSEAESKYVKERLVKFMPDLLIIYDGFNDAKSYPSERKTTEIMWKERWMEICDLGKQYGFETIVTLQPFLGAGNKIRFLEEANMHLDKHLIEIYPSFIKQLDELNLHCTKTADLRGIFDSITEPIYFDQVHVVAKGNQFVAENLYKLSLPTVLKKGVQSDSFGKSDVESLEIIDSDSLSENSDLFFEKSYNSLRNLFFSYKTPRALEFIMTSYNKQLPSQNDSDDSLVRVNLNGANLAGWDFSERNLGNAIFYGADLSNADFSNANLEGTDFRFANLDGVNFQQANLRGANFANVDLRDVDLFDVDLSGTNLSNVNLAWSNLTQTNFVQSNLTGANLKGAILTNTNLTGAILNHADLSVANLQGANLAGAILNHADLSVANLQGANLAGAILNHADLSVANLQGANLKDAKIMQATLKVTNLINADLTNAKLDGSDLFDANLQRAIVDNTSLKETKLSCNNHPICK